MIMLLLIAGAWIGLVLFVLGMFRVTTSTPTPRPASNTPLTLVDDARIWAAEPEPFDEAPRRTRLPIEAA